MAGDYVYYTDNTGGFGRYVVNPQLTTSVPATYGSDTCVWVSGGTTSYTKEKVVETKEEREERLEKERKARFEAMANPFRPIKIIISGKWTHCFFPDGSKEGTKVSVKHDGDLEDFDPEIGVAMCIAKYVYTSRCQFVKRVNNLAHYSDSDLKDFVEANREEYYAKLKVKQEKEAKMQERMKTSKARPLSA
jgi:hypothetical protein